MIQSDASKKRRVIAHIDADAFYASVHLIEAPELRGKPLIIAGDSPRSIVTTASYEARRYGIHSAQPASKARRLCPHGVFIRPDFSLYRSYSERAMTIVRNYCETVEPLSLDEAYLDITALKNPVRSMRQLVAEIHSATGLIYSVGIGPNKLCAKVLSDYKKPRAFNVHSREQCCEMFARSAANFLPSIGPKTYELLTEIGIETIADLRSAQLEEIKLIFGERRARELIELAHFQHSGKVEPDRPRKTMSEETTFADDISDLSELSSQLEYLTQELTSRLRERELSGRTIGIKVRFDDFTTRTRSQTIEEHTNDHAVVYSTAQRLLVDFAPKQPVRLLGVSVSRFTDEADGEPVLRRHGKDKSSQLVLPGIEYLT